jgi:probable rRNA maturation factor
MLIRVLNRQRKYRPPANELRDFSERLAPLVLKVARAELPEQILVVLVSDRKISAIHAQFMGITGPTDVITFQHGEIVVSVETAAKQATEYDTDLLHELHLYITHGLLHLAGYNDHSEDDFREMAKLQSELMERASSPRPGAKRET